VYEVSFPPASSPTFFLVGALYGSYGNSQDALLLMNGLRKCGTYTQWNFIQPQRRMKFCH
jgi:hypothetical protein